MDNVKRNLIDYLLSNYLKVDELYESTGDKKHEKVCLEIDSYLGYLGVDLFELEDKIFYVKMEDGLTFTKDFN